MRMLPALVSLAIIFVLFCTQGRSIPAREPQPAPRFEWQTAAPESQGMSSRQLDLLQNSLASKKTKSLLIIRNDKIVREWYADGHSAGAKHYTASMAKAIVGGLSLGVAIDDGRIALDNKAAKYIPQWQDDPLKSRITIRQLGSHTSALEDAEADGLPHDKLTGWKGDFWKQLEPPSDPFTISRDKTPALAEPGEKFQYSNPGIAMLSYAVTSSLKEAPEKDIRTLLRDRIMRPIGVSDSEWSAGYGKTVEVDGLPLVGSWGGGNYTARAVARVGRLMLREGDWEGKQLLSKETVREITRDAGTPGNCGMGWWSNNEQPHPALPPDAFWAAGAGHQILLIVPSLNLIVVRNGEALAADVKPADYPAALNQFLFKPLMAAVTDAPPQKKDERLRVIIETDAGGDPDDEQSLVRFLLYVNEWDVEGIIANRPKTRDGENLSPDRTGLGVVQTLVKAYGKCHPNLILHDRRYPDPEQLLRRTVPGYDDTDDGVKLIIEAVDRPDPRAIWFTNWGTDKGAAKSCLHRALDRVLKERGQAGYEKFKNRLRIIRDDKFGDHTTKLQPPWKLWVDTHAPELEGKRWYHRFSGLTATAGGFDLERDVRTGHGPLGALYPTNTTHQQKEGDTACFLYLIPTGMNDPREPTWGSWAGRYGANENYPGRPYHWANVADAWQGTTHRDNTLRRWAADLQNDFRARLDWCVKPYREANHQPLAVFGGNASRKIMNVDALVGSALSLSAKGSSDPDGNDLSYQWTIYPEPGTYRGSASFENADSQVVTLQIPADAAGKTIHVILTVKDSGTPPLVAYRRVIVTGRSRQAGEHPPSPVIKSAQWSPKETIVRRAKGCDNWPLTWADDDHLYTAYGDGNGFEPYIKEKLSLGLARIEGSPADFTGINLRAPTAEQKGEGKEGKKASGLLMVDGVLYLWARNAGNAQLAWSEDRGQTWSWSEWKFSTSFGCPTFLNFGRNFAGARDDFVYVYSHDSESAYTPADRMVLARVPKDRLRERDSYEFFQRLSEEGEPMWTKDISQRGAVFSHQGKCYRSGISFNAGLKRYLWCQTLPGEDPRFQGGLAIYDAPQPWGPWTTVYFTEGWDVGPGETSSFPTKWMSEDGTALYLVFSGDDHFSVRKATLTRFERK